MLPALLLMLIGLVLLIAAFTGESIPTLLKNIASKGAGKASPTLAVAPKAS